MSGESERVCLIDSYGAGDNNTNECEYREASDNES